jgi:SAM-dependent methyltransferase
MPYCRSCNSKLGAPFLSLGNSPLSNSYLSHADLAMMEPYYPLDLYVCSRCLLVQLEEFGLARNIFSADYAYFSSYSRSWLDHCRKFADMIIDRMALDEHSFVVEVASNDGYLLQYFKERNIPVLGIEPASGTAEIAISKGIPTEITFFNTAYGKVMLDENEQADLIIGNNVLAHNPDLNDFVEGLKLALKPAGVITMEFPHLLRLIEGNQFDTIYHEHYSYFSLLSVRNLFRSHSLEIFDVDELQTHGGSLRIYAKHSGDSSKSISDKVAHLMGIEEGAGLQDLDTYAAFGEKVKATKRSLLELLIGFKEDGKKIVGYGAPAKGNTLLNYCGVRADFLDYTVDMNPHKQNKFLPGTHIPVLGPERIREDKPDYLLILPWNIKDEIVEQMAYIKEWGGRFVVPVPRPEVL